jgi:phenylalanyl-tRNA synthetase beta chain
MIISKNWLKNFAKIDAGDDELFSRIGARLVEIESTENLAEKYADVVVAKVVSCVPHPDSDHMSLLKLDDGGKVDEIISRNIEKLAKETGELPEKLAKKYFGADKLPRDENGLLQVVCGAPNVRENMIVAWLPPTSIVPETYGTDDEFRLDARKLRGIVSYGMCAAADELGLWDEHDGILDLTDFAKVGDDFAKKLELNDTLLEVENKSLTHRPDSFGVIGFAREVAAIFDKESEDPKWFTENPDENFAKKDMEFALEKPNVIIDDAELCARYEGVVISGADGKKESDILRKSYLARSGMRPISAIVDISNYLMLLTGQPLHTFDYDKLLAISPTKKAEIIVRAARENEKMTLLDGREIEMSPKDIVIAAGNREESVAIALAGAMGGANTEIDEKTSRIFVESATFDLFNLRGTQFRHGIFSEAITRFTKGQPAALTDPVLRQAIAEFAKIGGEQVSEIVDNFAEKPEKIAMEIPAQKINDLLGTNYSRVEMGKVLNDLGYDGDSTNSDNGEILRIAKTPWWRTDLHITEDVAEDIGRVLGFDNIPLDLPTRKFTAVANPKLYDLQRKIREILKSFGANEVLTYSFISRKLAENLGLNADEMYKITNAISPELQLYRSTLTAKMLEKSVENIRAGYTDLTLFELGQTVSRSDGLTEENVPKMAQKLALIVANKNGKNKSPFYVAKKYLTELLAKFGMENAVDFREFLAAKNPYEMKRSAEIFAKNAHGNFAKIGEIGELKNSFREGLKLPEFTAMFELNLDEILAILPEKATKYLPVPKFQGTSRDMTFQVAMGENFAKIENAICEKLNDLPENFQTELEAKDIFSSDEKTKNLTFHAEFYDLEKTIDVKKIAKIVDEIAKSLREKFGAEMI